MIQNIARVGNFTSSEIAALMTNGKAAGTFGKPAYTYIDECNMERRLKRSITEESLARPLMWGKLNEPIAFDLLGLEYQLCSQETFVHPDFECWSGSPDAIKLDPGKTVVDFKCPMTLKSFCRLVDPLYDGLTGIDAMNAVRFGYTDSKGISHDAHKDGEKFYWQLVSNGCIKDAKYAELIVYCPYYKELVDIRLHASKLDGDAARGYYWLIGASDDELPYLPDDGMYRNINIIRFEIPEVDKRALKSRVRVAEERLLKV